MALHVKLDTGFLWNSHMLRCGAMGRLLYIGGLSYCVEHLSDGVIPKAALRRIADADDKAPAKTAQRLVEEGRWVDLGDCWDVHDYLTHQSAADDVAAKRARWADKTRKRRAGESKGMSTGVTPGDSEGESRQSPYIEPEHRARDINNSSTTHGGCAEPGFEEENPSSRNPTPKPNGQVKAAVDLLARRQLSAEQTRADLGQRPKIANVTGWLTATSASIADESGPEISAIVATGLTNPSEILDELYRRSKVK
jgi:hypothetical protein